MEFGVIIQIHVISLSLTRCLRHSLTLTNRSIQMISSSSPCSSSSSHWSLETQKQWRQLVAFSFISVCSLFVHATLSSRLPGDSAGEWHHPCQHTHLFPRQAPPLHTPTLCSCALPGFLKEEESLQQGTTGECGAHCGPVVWGSVCV